MNRRNAILLAWSAIAVPTSVSTVADENRELAAVDELANKLARIELEAIQAARPDSWQSVSYVTDKTLCDRFAAIYCVTSNTKLLDLWSVRVDRAMYPGKLRVYALAKAGQIEGLDDAYNHVTLMIVGRESLEQERYAFTDLLAKYPENALTC